jgi:K+-transporting ATPase ATPase C chain
MSVNEIAREVKPAVLLFVVFSVLTGLVYPLFITGVVQVAMPDKAGGSLIAVDGKIIGSELIGQMFTDPGYFHGRPSAVGYSANSSGASNLGPSSSKLMEQVSQRVAEVRSENNLPPDAPVPADLVLASGSGLDPHISPDAAMIQVKRVAKARGLPEEDVTAQVLGHVEPAQFGVLVQNRVNVLKLNLALDELTNRG